MSSTVSFSRRVLSWFNKHGRHDLPWQKNTTPYRVWVSEIMLQQTQVSTVIPYYKKFMRRFPGLKQLAGADIDEVMQYWAGLGYYARGRNLHKAAQVLMQQYKGKFPGSIDQVIALPGVGRSTAGAILSLSRGERHPILDGNVKRVLARHQLIEGWTGKPVVMDLLWGISDDLTPKKNAAEYNQAMMDLGATLCTRSKPACERCPLSNDCKALAHDRVAELPTPKKQKVLPVRETVMLVIKKGEKLLLEKRPPAGIWGGLWSLPECESKDDIKEFCKSDLGLTVKQKDGLDHWHHTFSHYRLNVTPVQLQVKDVNQKVMDVDRYAWMSLKQQKELALSAAVKKLKDL